MYINPQSSLSGVIQNLALPSESPTTSSYQSAPSWDAQAFPLQSLAGSATATTQSTQFHQVFQDVLQLFKAFVGTMRDLGLMGASTTAPQPAGDAADPAAEPTTGTGTSAGTGATPDSTSVGTNVSKVLDDLKTLYTTLKDNVSDVLGKLTKKSSGILGKVTGWLGKVGKLVTGKGAKSLLSKALKAVTSFF